MNVVSLFSGIGGLDAGLARAGFRHLLLCESDGWRRDVLRARFPGVPVYDDVRSVRRLQPELDGAGDEDASASWGYRPLRAVDLLAGGFPCQDLSVAGKRAGLAGERSGLFFEYARVVDAFRPRWLLVENVPGLLSSNGGRDFGVVLGTLADVGYGLAWRVLDSRFFGVPQRRRRVFIVGALAVGDPRAAAERAGEVLAVGARCSRHPATRGEAREDVAVASLSGPLGGGNDGIGRRSEDDPNLVTTIAVPLSHGSNPNSNMAGRRREDDENLVAYPISGDALRGEGVAKTPSADAEGRVRLRDPGFAIGENGDPAFTLSATSPGAVATASVRRLTPTECERLQGLPDGWTNPDGDAPDSRRYAGLGDAVTEPVGYWIGQRIIRSGLLAGGQA